MTNQYLSLVTLAISLIALYLSFKNRKTRLQSFSLAREAHNRNTFELVHIETKSFQNNHIIKMMVLNPSSTSLILNCVKFYRPMENKDWVSKLFGFRYSWNQTEIRWWPSEEGNNYKERFLEEAYDNLIVKDYKNIFIQVPGRIHSSKHKFEVITSFGTTTHFTTVTGSEKSFNLDFDKTSYS